ncbi:MAG: molybdate ABC transporter permease subunit [Gammaproteobacteria bacterium]
MDWQAFALSVQLGVGTVLLLLPPAFALARLLAYRRFRGAGFVEALVALPLVLPPTVVGFYLLLAFGSHSGPGRWLESAIGHSLAFSFEGLLVASVLINLPFAVQPIQNALAAIPANIRDAARCSGMNTLTLIRRIELPLAWPGLATALVLTFAHTLGEFGVVLMVGGSIPGETKTVAIAIYDRVQAFDDRAAGLMALALLVISLLTLGITNTLSHRIGRRG